MQIFGIAFILYFLKLVFVHSFFTLVSLQVDMYKWNDSFCHSYTWCVFLHLTDSLFPISSITHLMCICMDRWYAITKPFNYVTIVTPTRARSVIVGVWFYAILWTSLGKGRLNLHSLKNKISKKTDFEFSTICIW